MCVYFDCFPGLKFNEDDTQIHISSTIETVAHQTTQTPTELPVQVDMVEASSPSPRSSETSSPKIITNKSRSQSELLSSRRSSSRSSLFGTLKKSTRQAKDKLREYQKLHHGASSPFTCHLCDIFKVLLILAIIIAALIYALRPDYTWTIVKFDNCTEFSQAKKSDNSPFLTNSGKLAIQHCQDFGQKMGENWVLMTPKSQLETEFLKNNMTSRNQHTWLGIKRDQGHPLREFHMANSNTVKVWRSRFFYENWAENQPSKDIRNACVVHTERGWEAQTCQEKIAKKDFFCEIRRC